MFRILIAATVAISLFLTGWSLLISIRNEKTTTQPQMVLDFESYCDEDAYLAVGNSDDPSIATIKSADEPGSPPNLPLDPDGSFSVVQEGETLHSILNKQRVSEQEISLLGMALKPFMPPTDLAPGDFYRFSLNNQAGKTAMVESFTIRKLDPTRLPILYRVKRVNNTTQSDAFSVEIDTPKVEEVPAFISLTVGPTLYQTFSKLPFGPELMQRLILIFAWEMRMPEEVSAGDQIEMVVVKKYAMSEFIGYGKIESVYYRQKQRTRFGTYFVSKDRRVQGFFDENGKSLEREFSYSPVYETTATSDQKWRLHPIRKIRIRHNGVDYRGAIGTDFFSIADGEVIEKRYDRNVGNMIRIKHKYEVHSEYFHADTLVDTLAVGSRVKRGQKIGTIGRTGRLCTGPHLHMGLYRLQGEKRKFLELSSLRKVLKPAPNIDASHLAEFKEHVNKLLAFMKNKTNMVVADKLP